jgi:hypothetical protein
VKKDISLPTPYKPDCDQPYPAYGIKCPKCGCTAISHIGYERERTWTMRDQRKLFAALYGLRRQLKLIEEMIK